MQRRGTNEEKETTGYDSEQLETIGKATKQLDVSKKPKGKGGKAQEKSAGSTGKYRKK